MKSESLFCCSIEMILWNYTVSVKGKVVLFLCPATKSGRVLCYTLRTFDCPSVRPSIHPSIRPSAVEHSCQVHNFDTV